MIFLSYSHADKHIITPIAEAFQKVFGKEQVFFDQWSIQPGNSIVAKMDAGLASCQFFFFFVSKSSLTSKMVGLEWRNALMKSVRAGAKVIPVKIDDCSMPSILMESLYINLYTYGLDFAVRQMIEVASGQNTYKPGNSDEFQNIKAYVSGSKERLKIEFRAEAYTEPHSKFLILHENAKDEVECRALSTGLFESGFSEKVQLSDGRCFNAFQIGRSEATSPKFPFIVEFLAKAGHFTKFIGVMRAVSHESFQVIPHVCLEDSMPIS
jgi:hypothetical protein